jgi:hypothetical protein
MHIAAAAVVLQSARNLMKFLEYSTGFQRVTSDESGELYFKATQSNKEYFSSFSISI